MRAHRSGGGGGGYYGGGGARATGGWKGTRGGGGGGSGFMDKLKNAKMIAGTGGGQTSSMHGASEGRTNGLSGGRNSKGYPSSKPGLGGKPGQHGGDAYIVLSWGG